MYFGDFFFFCRRINCDPTCEGISRFPQIRKACWLAKSSRDYEDLKKVIPAALELHNQPGLGLQQISSFVHQRNSILAYSCWYRNSGTGCFEPHLNFPLKDVQETQYLPIFFFTLLNCQFSICPHTLAGMALNSSDPYRALVHAHRAYSQQPGGDNHL